ncbi:MAG TPA: hypothetical protein VEJ18_04300 [Planctomycetota bacterium]|nr:hypothetical protein [Planctomycetota bacterium]
MKKAWAWILIAGTGCGNDAPPPGGGSAAAAPTPVASSPAPPGPAAANDVAPAQAAPGGSDELHPLRLSVLQSRITPGTVFYLHDPRMDPEGRLGERPHPLRDVYRPAGRYLMRFSKKGYRPVDLTVGLSARGIEPALETLTLAFDPTEELAGPYAEAEAALGAQDAKKARAALEKVRELDPGFRETEQLFARLVALEERQERERKAVEEALAKLRQGDLGPASAVPSLAAQVDQVRAARERFEQAIPRFDIVAAEAELGSLRERLTPEDPANRERAGRIDDLKAIRAVLDQYEAICLDPQAARERLADLWDKDRADRMGRVAEDLARFSRHARFVALRHEPGAYARKGDEAEVRARLTARYTLAAGEAPADGRVIVRLRKSDAWRISDYREAP